MAPTVHITHHVCRCPPISLSQGFHSLGQHDDDIDLGHHLRVPHIPCHHHLSRQYLRTLLATIHPLFNPVQIPYHSRLSSDVPTARLPLAYSLLGLLLVLIISL